MDLRSIQKPLKDAYRQEPDSARITLTARSSQQDTPMACSVDLGRTIYKAQAHKGVGGAGTAACSGDLLLGALAACAQITCQMVATAMGIPTERIEVTVEGDMDLRGTLGISKDVPVGFEQIRVRYAIDAPQAAVLRRDANADASTDNERSMDIFQLDQKKEISHGTATQLCYTRRF
jgi:uncharacterized OsmC-like protein